MLALPLLLVLAFAVGDEPEGRRGVSLIDVATNGSLNFVLFVLFVSTGFLLVVVFALFFGDTVASEAGLARCATCSPSRCRDRGCSHASSSSPCSCPRRRCSPCC